MSDPTTSTAAGIAGHKVIIIGLPIAASLLAFWLGMRIVPLRVGKESTDAVNRIMACVVSSFLVGMPVLAQTHEHMPGVFASAQTLAVLYGFPPFLGLAVLMGCTLLLCSLPGPWLLVALVMFFENRKHKDPVEIYKDLKKDLQS